MQDDYVGAAHCPSVLAHKQTHVLAAKNCCNICCVLLLISYILLIFWLCNLSLQVACSSANCIFSFSCHLQLTRSCLSWGHPLLPNHSAATLCSCLWVPAGVVHDMSHAHCKEGCKPFTFEPDAGEHLRNRKWRASPGWGMLKCHLHLQHPLLE